MSNDKALATRFNADFDPQHPGTLEQVGAIADVLYRSEYFDDLKGASQACVKIIAGKELGIPAIASVREINVFDGNIELSYTMMGSLLRQHQRYDYEIIESQHLRAEIAFTRDGEKIGTSVYTIEDAARAGLCKIGDDGWPRCRTRSGRKMPWEKYPKAMCLARAMSQGVRTYAPDISHGSIYAEGEISEEPQYLGDARVVEDAPEAETSHAPSGDSVPPEAEPEPAEPAPAQEQNTPTQATWRGDTVSQKQADALAKIEQGLTDCDTVACTLDKIQKALNYADGQPDAYAERIRTLVREAELALYEPMVVDGVDRKAIWNALNAARDISVQMLEKQLKRFDDLDESDAVALVLTPYWGTVNLWKADGAERFDTILQRAQEILEDAVEDGHYTEGTAEIAQQIIYEEAHAAADHKGIPLAEPETPEGDDLFGKPELAHNDEG